MTPSIPLPVNPCNFLHFNIFILHFDVLPVYWYPANTLFASSLPNSAYEHVSVGLLL